MPDERSSMNERDLNHFWNELVRPTGEPVAGGGALDPAMADTIRRLQSLGAAPPPASSRERVRQAVRAHVRSQRASSKETPVNQAGFFDVTHPAWEPNGRIETPSRPWPRLRFPATRRRWMLAQLSTAILLIITLFGLYFTFHENRPAVAPGTPEPATPAATPAADVPMYRGDVGRTGVMPGPGPEGQPTDLWRFQAQGPVDSAPAVVGGVVYVTSGDGALHAVDAISGDEIWSFPAVAGLGAPTVAGGLAYVGSDDGNLYAVDAASGEERWRYPAGGRSGVTVPIDGVLYGATNQGVAFALDAATGTERWRQQVTTVNLRGPAVADGVLYFGGDDGTLYTLDAATGAVGWTFASGWGLIVTPTVADGAIYLSARNDETMQGELISVGAATGQERWRFKTPSGAALWPATVADGVAYVGGWDGTVYALDAVAGTERWHTATGVNQLHGAPVLVGDTLYEGAEDRAVYAFDAATGTMRWRFPLDGDLGELAVANGVLYVGTGFGMVYAIGGSDEGLNISAPAVAGSPPATPAATPATGQAAAAPTGPVQFLWQTAGGPEPLLPAGSVTLAPDGNLWVVDGASSRFQIFSPDGTFLEVWGTAGAAEGQFNFVRTPGDPYNSVGDIAFDAQGGFYVTDSANHRVQQFDRERRFVRAWGGFGSGDGQFADPYGIAVDAAGNVYVIDDQRDDVQKFDADGRFLLKFGGHGAGPGQLNYTGSLTLDAAGNVYVADFDNHRVQKFSSDGLFLAAWGSLGTGEGQLNGPGDVAVDADGRVYVTDLGNHRVQVFDGSGAFLAAWGEEGTGEGQFVAAAGIALDGEGNVYVADIAGRVQKFRLLPPLGPA